MYILSLPDFIIIYASIGPVRLGLLDLGPASV